MFVAFNFFFFIFNMYDFGHPVYFNEGWLADWLFFYWKPYIMPSFYNTCFWFNTNREKNSLGMWKLEKNVIFLCYTLYNTYTPCIPTLDVHILCILIVSALQICLLQADRMYTIKVKYNWIRIGDFRLNLQSVTFFYTNLWHMTSYVLLQISRYFHL